MNKKVLMIAAIVVVIAAAAFTMMSGGSKEGAEVAGKVDLNSLTVEQLLAKAKEEGRVDSVGMPDSWANWVQTWTDLKDKYGIEHTDVDMSSAEELAIFEAEKDNATKDIGDVGQSFGPLAESKGLTLPYKTSYWDEIPAWAKDDDGDWVIGYYGTIAIITNRKLVPNPPKSFADVLEGDYMVTPGNVAQATQAQNALLAAAIANGGSETNLQPGFDFFRKLAEQGRIDKGEPNVARLEKGEIACYFIWDYNALGYRDQFKANNPRRRVRRLHPRRRLGAERIRDDYQRLHEAPARRGLRPRVHTERRRADKPRPRLRNADTFERRPPRRRKGEDAAEGTVREGAPDTGLRGLGRGCKDPRHEMAGRGNGLREIERWSAEPASISRAPFFSSR